MLPDAKPSRLPRWRGSNLEDKKDRNGAPHKNGPYREQDFEIAAGWGWAIWNLRGAYGVLDSRREDVAYEEFRGHRLDRKMLELLQAH